MNLMGKPLHGGASAVARLSAELLPALAEGSMRPKVQASITFVRETGGTALVTSAAVLEEALAGRAGTTIS